MTQPGEAEPVPDADGSAVVGRLAPRWLVLIVMVLAVIFVVVLFFVVGRHLPWFDAAPVAAPSTSTSTATATSGPVAPSATTPATTPALAPAPGIDSAPVSGPVAVGVHPWDELRGGECVDPYASPWAETFAVVDCAAPHGAQLISRTALSVDPAAPYPGDPAITAQLNLACTAPSVLDFAAAGAFSDVQWQASYPVSAEQWAAGARDYSCFISRSGGDPLIGSVQTPAVG